MVSTVFILSLAFLGMWFPIQPGITLANISVHFPVHHLITAVLGLFNLPAGANPWADLL